MSDRESPREHRRTATPGFPATGILVALLALAPAGCSGTKSNFVPLPVATEARILTLTLDACDCSTCRVAVQDPSNGRVLFNRTGLPVGTAVVAAACYTELTVRATLECGICPGPAPCTATATLTASGDPTAGGPVTCSATIAGTGCQDQRLLTISEASPTVSCAP